MKTIQVTCVITGKTYNFNTDYVKSKYEKLGGEANFNKYYITSDAKKLLDKGLSVKEIRKILGSSSNIEINEEYFTNIKKYNDIEDRLNTFVPLSVITCFETDPEVKDFLNSI
jgi:hypothetical protein